MKLDKRIIQWFSVQEHLFAVFVLLELIPNYILFFTESYPVTIRIASLMIPLGSFAILFSVFKRPGVMFWTLFIKFLLDALQLTGNIGRRGVEGQHAGRVELDAHLARHAADPGHGPDTAR